MKYLKPKKVRDLLFDTIDSLEKDRSASFSNPNADFTRKRLISFSQTMLCPMLSSDQYLKNVLDDLFPPHHMPTMSAMVQQRKKIPAETYLALFKNFSCRLPHYRKYRNLRLIAVDGSCLNLPNNPSDKETYWNSTKTRRGCNQLHLNAFFDDLNKVFVDVEVQTRSSLDEIGACRTMLDRYKSDDFSTLFLMDRGYFSYNTVASVIYMNQYFLIRLKKQQALKLFSDSSWLQSETADKTDSVHLSRSRTKEIRSLPNFHHMHDDKRYAFFSPDKKVDSLELRVLKFPISDDTEEYIVTNLPADKFSMDEIKSLYHNRWGIETAFRELKYPGCLSKIYSRKRIYQMQEIYAKLTLFNFASYIAMSAKTTDKSHETRYSYAINRTHAFSVVIKFLKDRKIKVLELIQKEKVPVRPGRAFPRDTRKH